MSKRIEILTEPEIEPRKKWKYSYRFRIPAHHGKPEEKSPWQRSNAKTKAAVRREAEEYRKELEDQINDFKSIENITFAEYARRWHERRKELEEVKLTSWEADGLLIRQIEKSVLGSLDIKEIDENDLDEFKAENKRLGFSNDRQDKLLKKVKQILKYAEQRRAIKHNPSGAVVNIKRDIKDKRKALTREAQDKLLEDLEAEEITGKTVVVRIALSTGFRRGECLGLQWRDIDFDNRIIILERQLTAKGNYEAPKYNGTGIIPIGGGLVRYLRQWKEITSERYYKGKRVPEDSPVCRNDNGGQLQSANFDKWRRDWFVDHGLGEYTEIKETWDSKGRKRYHKTGYKGYRLHELRHTMATELVGSADLKSAQSILRHTNISTTAGYIHGIDDNIRNAADQLERNRESGLGTKERKLLEKDKQSFDRKKEKRKAYKRQKGKCFNCKKAYDISEMETSFITPFSEGGELIASNIRLVCKHCNMEYKPKSD